MQELQLGQKLWWKDDVQREVGTVEVVAIYKTVFCVRYKGKIYSRNYKILGKKLFLKNPAKTYYNTDKSRIPQYQRDYYQTLNGHDEKPYLKEKTISKQSYSPAESSITSQIENCSNCSLAHNGMCSGLKKRKCKSYQPLHLFADGERANWPKYGDACAAGMGNRKRYK